MHSVRMTQPQLLSLSQHPGVFVSHSSADKPFLRHLVTLLRGEGIGVWLDELELRPGDGLLERISGQIAASLCLIAVISQNSIRSRWVSTELMQALRLEMEGRGPRVIPIKIDDCEVPPYLVDKIYGDFSRPQYMAQALRSLVMAMRAAQPLRAVSVRDELEQELARTTLRDADLRLVVQVPAAAAVRLGDGRRRALPAPVHARPDSPAAPEPGCQRLVPPATAPHRSGARCFRRHNCFPVTVGDQPAES